MKDDKQDKKQTLCYSCIHRMWAMPKLTEENRKLYPHKCLKSGELLGGDWHTICNQYTPDNNERPLMTIDDKGIREFK